jgi:hemolysin-activating ACP:hemolysin acyltransferase
MDPLTHYSNLRVDGRCPTRNPSVHEVIGMVSELFFKAKVASKRSVRYLETQVREAQLHEQLQLFFSEDRVLVGYASWALLSSQTEAQILRDGRIELHRSEWNEGDSLWLIDIVALPGRFKYIIRALRDETFASHERVRFARTRNGRISIHEVLLRRSAEPRQNNQERPARFCRCGLTVSECVMNK